MKKEFIEERKKQLLKEKQEVEKNLEEFAKKNPKAKGDYRATFVDIGPKDEDSAVEVADYGDRLALEEELEKNLAKINYALEKIKKGTYGICEKCSKEISEKRLIAFPAATTCTKC